MKQQMNLKMKQQMNPGLDIKKICVTIITSINTKAEIVLVEYYFLKEIENQRLRVFISSNNI